MNSDLIFYNSLLNEIKNRIRQAQIRAAISANAEMILMYWDIGRMIHQRQQMEGWGAGIIPGLARDIRNELPEVKGFSERNIGYMVRFFREYGEPPILQQAVAKLPGSPTKDEILFQSAEKTVPKGNHPDLQQHVAKIPWGHNILLMEKVKDLHIRLWYIRQTIEQGWGRDTLAAMIRKKVYERHGQAVNNFSNRLPTPQSELASRMLKDPYLFDFLTLEEPFHERELETGLIRHLEHFLL